MRTREVILANQLESRSGTAATALAIGAQFNKMSDHERTDGTI